ncbi:GNAT family N-acetyltransferase [Paenibacillus flagellatus]|uniref:GNAT family N-acetyltransferase n=1 Tax=Paenibacillus flagellatus TaxID=2211139 RepID=A0A2V5JVF9_9BACL|nr:GNAT family N-acetyltransferase [Paenibacillus flagellatus]PYI50679.1 GNAT family N-acetyltransferase [Paenibacillus flagellatus]
MMNVVYSTLEGTSVKLAPMKREHAEPLYEAGRDPAVWTYMQARMQSPEQMRAIVDEAVAAAERGEELPYTIFDAAGERALGSTRLYDMSVAHRNLEIGWTWLTPSVWRTRVNTECKRLLLAHAFETMGAIRVQLKADARNARSRQAIERIGGVYEGTLRQHRILPDGFIRDTVYYSILEREWPEAKRRLDDRLARRD